MDVATWQQRCFLGDLQRESDEVRQSQSAGANMEPMCTILDLLKLKKKY